MRTEIDLNESEINLNESEIVLNESVIDLNQCEHFLKANLDRSKWDPTSIDPSWIDLSVNVEWPHKKVGVLPIYDITFEEKKLLIFISTPPTQQATFIALFT